MNGAHDLARRIMRRLTGPQRSSVTTEVDEDGQTWLIIRGPQIVPGEPGAIFGLPEKEPIESGEPGVICCLPDNGREPYASSS